MVTSVFLTSNDDALGFGVANDMLGDAELVVFVAPLLAVLVRFFEFLNSRSIN